MRDARGTSLMIERARTCRYSTSRSSRVGSTSSSSSEPCCSVPASDQRSDRSACAMAGSIANMRSYRRAYAFAGMCCSNQATMRVVQSISAGKGVHAVALARIHDDVACDALLDQRIVEFDRLAGRGRAVEHARRQQRRGAIGPGEEHGAAVVVLPARGLRLAVEEVAHPGAEVAAEALAVPVRDGRQRDGGLEARVLRGQPAGHEARRSSGP